MTLRRTHGPLVLRALVIVVLSSGLRVAPAIASALPDHRVDELVSSVSEEGHQSVLSGNPPDFAAISQSGEVVDWESLGLCCGAPSGQFNTYQAERTPTGWQSHSISPPPKRLLAELEFQEPVLTSTDLSNTIFSTPESYAPGDDRPPSSGGMDLYLRGSGGALTWLSQGPFGTGTTADAANLAGATPDAENVLFDTREQLTADAVGLAAQKGASYLYMRNVRDATTSLIDVNSSDGLISPYGASLGDAGPAPETPIERLERGFGFLYAGSTSHAVSEDGSKAFFEAPPPGLEGQEPHLYMRDLTSGTTTSLDDPAAAGSAHYQGATPDGSLVFFTSDEGLGGASTENVLYEFNTTAHAIGPAPPMTAVPLASGAGILGVTAISNDGSHVFFVAESVLAGNVNSVGRAAVPNQPNLYAYDTTSGEASFVATLAPPDVSTCSPTCASGDPARLVAHEDISRPAYPTPDGSLLVFTSSNDLTGEGHAPSTTLSSEEEPGSYTIEVGSTAGLHAGEEIAIGTGAQEQTATIETVDSPTELSLGSTPAQPFAAGTAVTAVDDEVYRYATAGNTLTCLSCTPAGVPATDSATLGEVAGGSYAPPGHAAQMNEDGTRIFFDSPDPLLPGMAGVVTVGLLEETNVYEWDDGTLHLISDASGKGSEFHGTTPSGGDAFFSAWSQLVPSAAPGYEHLYDARVDGGFPTEVTPADPCAVEACRPSGLHSTVLSPTASASMGPGGDEPSGKPGRPTFTVAKITAAQRSALASSGVLMLRVSASAPGTLVARATARLHGRRTGVARGSATLAGAGETGLKLRLSTAARAALRKDEALNIQIEVVYRTTGDDELVQLTVQGRPPGKDARHA